ncbi:MAG: hypothetical protein JNM63_00695, partial [Spirochaetia bacterium]|nr:hypothetical protein [Spirochaetia bacterium]
PYWEDERGLSDYFGRLSYLLTRGERQIETLVLHPIGSQWAEYDVLTYLDPNANHLGWAGIAKSTYDAPFKTLTDHLLARRLDFHYGDEIIMERHASVDGKNFKIGRCTYQTLVVPPSLTWRASTLALLEEFAANGGHLIFVGATPTLIDAHEPLDCRKTFPKASFVKTNEKVSELIRKETRFVQIENIPTGKETDEIFIHSRKLEDGRIVVFLTNTHETKVIESRITLPWLGAVERVNCDNGQIVSAEVELRGNAMELEHKFFGGDAVMFLIDPKSKPIQKTASPKTGRHLLLTEWKGRALEDNMLRIDEVSLWLAGKKVLENAPVYQAWDEHFYAAEDGTPFEAEYRFQVDEKPEGEIRAVIEMAQNLSSILVNGVAVKPDGKNWHNDFAMSTVDITTALKTGENRIHLSGKKV